MQESEFLWAATVFLAWSGIAAAQSVLAPEVPQQNLLARAAVSVGVKRCLPAVSRLAALTVQGSVRHDVLLDWDRKRPDVGPVFSLIGIEYQNAGVASTITAIPNEAGSCTVSAERISLAPVNCSVVAKNELADYKMTRLLSVFAVYVNDKEPTSSVSLIDSPPGCLVVRRYVEFNWNEPGTGVAIRALPVGPGAKRP